MNESANLSPGAFHSLATVGTDATLPALILSALRMKQM